MAKKDLIIPETSIGTGIPYGSIRFMPAVADKPATSETTGNVTVNNSAVPGHPASFTASYTINASHNIDGCRTTSTVMLTFPVMAEKTSGEYKVIEDSAAEKIAPILRQIADQIEAEVNRINAKDAAFDAEKETATKPNV